MKMLLKLFEEEDGYVLTMNGFVLNITRFVLDITGFIKQKNLDIMGWPYTRSNLVLVRHILGKCSTVCEVASGLTPR